MKIGIVTLFPKAFTYFENPEQSGLVHKAKSRVETIVEDLREHGEGKHKTVDDSPYGGGDGMVLKAEPLKKAFEALSGKMNIHLNEAHKIYFDPKGELWTQKKAEDIVLQKMNRETPIILLCGRYAGVDQRFIDSFIDQKISVGPFVLNGGELPALCFLETVFRLLPEVLGNPDSFKKDSFSSDYGHSLEGPLYTRPREWEGRQVPEVLFSGDHKKIRDYEEQLMEKESQNWYTRALNDFEALREGKSKD